MDFSKQYLNYNEYRQLGGTLDIVPFNLSESQVRQKIDEKTLLRLRNKKDIPVEVKTCVFKLVEGMNFDGNYLDADEQGKEKYIDRIIYDNLLTVIVDNTPLLYRGV